MAAIIIIILIKVITTIINIKITITAVINKQQDYREY